MTASKARHVYRVSTACTAELGNRRTRGREGRGAAFTAARRGAIENVVGRDGRLHVCEAYISLRDLGCRVGFERPAWSQRVLASSSKSRAVSYRFVPYRSVPLGHVTSRLVPSGSVSLCLVGLRPVSFSKEGLRARFERRVGALESGSVPSCDVSWCAVSFRQVL